MRRRRRLREALLCLVALAAGVSGGRASSPGLLVTVGDVGPRSALLWLRASGPAPASVEVGAVGGPPERRLTAAPVSQADFTAKVRVDGLDPGTRYAYRVRWQAEVADEAREVGCRAVTALVDVRAADQVKRAVDLADRTFGRLDILVNNAAAPPGADRVPVVELPEEAWHAILETNLTGTYLCSK